MDAVITLILISLFAISIISGCLSYREITKFTKWLHENRYHDWLKLGAPDAPFWKGQAKPNQEPRYREPFNGFQRTFRNSVPAFSKKFKEDEAQKIFHKYRITNRISTLSLFAFGAMVFIAIFISP